MSAEAASSAEEWTVRRVLEWTIGHLKTHGSDSARLDAEVLLAHARGCSKQAKPGKTAQETQRKDFPGSKNSLPASLQIKRFGPWPPSIVPTAPVS